MTASTAIVGRARAVLVCRQVGRDASAVATVNARRLSGRRGKRLRIEGMVRLDRRTRAHLKRAVFAVADRIAAQLVPNYQPAPFELSFVDLSPSTITDNRLTIADFSSDAAVAVAVVSETLQISVRQDIAFSGCMASEDGELSPASDLVTKLPAGIRDVGIRTIVCPHRDAGRSMRSPAASQRRHAADVIATENVLASISHARGVDDLLRAAFIRDDILVASLRSGYFEVGPLANAAEQG